MSKPVKHGDQTIKQIIAMRKKVLTGKRTKQVMFLASPEEHALIKKRFGGPAGLRDFALGITDLGYVYGSKDELEPYDLNKAAALITAIRQIADITSDIVKLEQSNET